MKLRNIVRQYGAKIAAPVAGGLLLVGTSAHAALDTAVTTAITSAETDMLALYAALTATGVVIWVGRLLYNHFRVK